jgi:hypothetical protein
MPNPNFDDLLSTTLNNHRKNLEDNVFTARPLVNFLTSRGRLDTLSGGAKIIEPLMYAKNTTAGSYSGYDTIGTTPQTFLTAAEYAWRQYAATISINGLEEAQNDGEAEILSLLSARTEQTEETISENFDQMFFLDGTGNAGKDWLGLAAIVSTTVVLGNIDPATNAWWQAVVKAGGVRSDDDWTNAFNTASKGNNRPDFGLTTQVLYEAYESSLAPSLRLQSNREADARFEHLMFKNVPLYFDTYCQSGVTYFLNSKYLKLKGHRKVWFKNTPFVKPSNQDARFAQVLCYGNLVTSNRSRQAKITGQTA